VGHPHLVDVREAQGDLHVAPGQVLSDLVYLPSDIASGPEYEVEELAFHALGQEVCPEWVHARII